MELAQEKVNNGIKYNYWIYVSTCLAVAMIALAMPSFDPKGQRDVLRTISGFFVVFILSSLAWDTGKDLL